MTTYAGPPVFPQYFVDPLGKPLRSVKITVYERGTDTKPDLYADREKSTPLGNPFWATSLGNAEFRVDAVGEFEAEVNGVRIPFTVLADPEEPVTIGAGVIQEAMLEFGVATQIELDAVAAAAAAGDSGLANAVEAVEEALAGKQPTIPLGTYVQAGRVFLSATGSDANAGDVPGSPLLTLPAAITAAGGDYTRVTVSGAVAVAATVTVPANVTLDFEPGGQLVPAAGVEVTINGAIGSPRPRHIFDVTDGDVFFGPFSWVHVIFPQWFGANGDRQTNQTTAVVKTFASIRHKQGVTEAAPTYSGPGVHLPSGTYLVDADTLLINNIIHLKVTGDGSRAHADYAQGSSVILINGPGTQYGMKIDTSKARNFSMEHVAVEYNSDLFTGDLFDADATGGTLRNCSFGFDNDNDTVPAGLERFSANSCVHFRNKEWTIENFSTTGSQYGILLEDTCNTTQILNGVVGDHVICGVKTADGASPLQTLNLSGVYFNIVRLNGTTGTRGDGSTIELTRPVSALNINANGFDIAGCWFSGATAAARWTGAALVLKGTGRVGGCNITCTTGPGIEVTSSGSVVSLSGNWVQGDPPLIHRAGVLVEDGNDFTVTAGGVSTTHVDLNPDNDVCGFRCGPSRFRSVVTNSYRAHSTGTNQQGLIFSQSIRNASTGPNNGVSVPSGGAISVIPLGGANIQLASPVELKGALHEGLSVANTTATTTLSLVNGNVFDRTLAVGTTTFEFSGAIANKAGSFTLILRHGADGRTVNFPASVKWPNGSPPSLSTVSGSVDVLTFVTVDGGTTWLGGLNGVGYA
jgi:hypothetical protein